jgi:hypothetical protein
MTDNLELWHAVETTDPKAVKPITGKQYKGNSPKPHWLVRRATEVFGPCGIGWGFEVKESQYTPTEAGVLHSATIRVWYDWQGKRGVVEHVGGTPASGKRQSGQVFYDEDAAKKSVTDGLVKALSMIGFAADIFDGRWDDSKYVETAREEFSPTARKPDARRASQDQLDELVRQLDRTGRSALRLLKHYGVDDTDKLTADQANGAIDLMKAMPDKPAKEAAE